MDCLLFGKCIRYNYDYYFYLNNEKLKADYCSSDYTSSSCKLNGQIYTNVTYEKIFLGEESYQSTGLIEFLPYFLIIVFFFFAWHIFFTDFFRLFSRK